MSIASGSELERQIRLREDDERVRQVGRDLIGGGLGDEISLFAPGRPVWSAGTVDELYGLYNEHLDYGSGTFLGKLRGQGRLDRARWAPATCRPCPIRPVPVRPRRPDEVIAGLRARRT